MENLQRTVAVIAQKLKTLADTVIRLEKSMEELKRCVDGDKTSIIGLNHQHQYQKEELQRISVQCASIATECSNVTLKLTEISTIYRQSYETLAKEMVNMSHTLNDLRKDIDTVDEKIENKITPLATTVSNMLTVKNAIVGFLGFAVTALGVYFAAK